MVERCPPKALECENDSGLVGRFFARVPAGTKPETVGKQEYFGALMTQDRVIREGDFIEVMPEDMSWYGRLCVRVVQKDLQLCSTVWIDGPKSFDGEEIEHAQLSVEWKGAHRKYCVMNGEEVVEGGFVTKEAAQLRLMKIAQDKAA